MTCQHAPVEIKETLEELQRLAANTALLPRGVASKTLRRSIGKEWRITTKLLEKELLQFCSDLCLVVLFTLMRSLPSYHGHR